MQSITPAKVSEKAAAGAARAGEKAKEAKTAAAHKLEEAQHGLDEMHLTDRVSELKHAAAERMHEAGDRISTAHSRNLAKFATPPKVPDFLNTIPCHFPTAAEFIYIGAFPGNPST